MYIHLTRRRGFKKTSETKSTVLQILVTGIEKERESINFYKKAAQRTIDAKGKQMLEELAEEEKCQIDLLETEYRVRLKNKPSYNKMKLVEAG